MNVTYQGPHEGVRVLALDRTVKRGETLVDVDPELGGQLVAQGWTEGSAKAPTKDEVLAEVGDDPVAAADALASELAAAKPRKTLVDALQSVIDANPADEADTTKENV